MLYKCSDMCPMDDLETLGNEMDYVYSIIEIANGLIYDRNHYVSKMQYDCIWYRKAEWYGKHEIIISVENPWTGKVDKYYPSIDEFIDLLDYVRTKEIESEPEKIDQINQSFSLLLDFFDRSVIPTPPDIIAKIHAVIDRKRDGNLQYADPENNLVYYYELLPDNSVCITGAEADNFHGNLIIPAEINGYPVTNIGDGAFAKSSMNGHITLPESVTEIGDAAFYYCELICSILIPKSVTKIGRFAFNWCGNLGTEVFSGSYAESFCQNNCIDINKVLP